MRIMAIDPGDKRIGLAISDDLEISVNPIGIILHESRKQDAEAIIRIAKDRKAEMLVIGCAFNDDGTLSLAGRKAVRLAEEIKEQTIIPVVIFDETNTTNEAVELAIEMGLPQKNRKGHRDEIAAMIILQKFFDSRSSEKS